MGNNLKLHEIQFPFHLTCFCSHYGKHWGGILPGRPHTSRHLVCIKGTILLGRSFICLGRARTPHWWQENGSNLKRIPISAGFWGYVEHFSLSVPQIDLEKLHLCYPTLDLSHLARFRSKITFFLQWPLEATPLTLGQIWRNLSDGEFNYLSNAVFGFALAIIVPEIMEVFRNDVWQSRKTRKFGHFLALGATILTSAKNWLKQFRNHFWRAFERFFPFFSTTNRSWDRRGCSNTPPPSRWWKIWSARGARVKVGQSL